MVLRHIYEHVRSHNWFAVAVDFVIVVLGVFVGIQVSNWNAEYIQRREARIYLERIREDNVATAERLTDVIATNETIRSHALAALDAFDRAPAELGEEFLVDAYLAASSWTGTVERSSYDELLSEGAAHSIPDIELRLRLANYYKSVTLLEKTLEYVAPYVHNARRLMPYVVQAEIKMRCGIVFSVDSRFMPKATFREHCDLGLPPKTIAAGIAAIRTLEFKRDLVRRVSDLDNKLEIFQRLLDRGRMLDEFLAKSIN